MSMKNSSEIENRTRDLPARSTVPQPNATPRAPNQPPAGRIMSMKNSSDIIENLTHDLPACSTVPQPTATLRAPNHPVYVPIWNIFRL
jgi:hypothetical protein